jgi:hypothetical protein
LGKKKALTGEANPQAACSTVTPLFASKVDVAARGKELFCEKKNAEEQA